MLRTVRLPSAENVVSGGRFQVKLPIGPTYTDAGLQLGGSITAAIIGELEFAINGRPVQRFASGTDLDKINQIFGIPASSTNGILTIPFRQSWLEEQEEAELFDIGTARPTSAPEDRDSPIVETLTISGTLGTFTSGTITPWATTSSKIRPLRMIRKVLNFPKTMAASSSGTENDFDSFPIGYPNAALLAAVVKETTAGIVSKVRVNANIGGVSMDLLESTPVAVLKQSGELGYKARTVVSGYPLIDFIGSGQLLDAVPLGAAGDLRARLTLTSGSVTSETETVYTIIADTFQGA